MIDVAIANQFPLFACPNGGIQRIRSTLLLRGEDIPPKEVAKYL